MNLKFKSVVAGALALMSASALLTVSAPAAQAATCGSDRVLASSPTDLYANFAGVIGNKHLGKLYIGYIPSCRMEYAEVHWDNNLYLNMSSSRIWLQDGAGNQAGSVNLGAQSVIGGEFQSSSLISIDSASFYAHSEPRLSVGLTYAGSTPVPICRPSEYYGAWHRYSDGYNSTGHTWQNCGI